MKKQTGNVPLRDLWFYFDALERDRLDQGRLGRKAGQVLALREKLLALNENEFDSAMTTIERVVSSMATKHTSAIDRATEKKTLAAELYERTAVAAPTSRVGAPIASDQISKV